MRAQPTLLQPTAIKPASPRHQGSVLVLVIVALVLMVTLAATFLSVARTQRLADDAPVNNIDAVMDTVIEKIQEKMVLDLIPSSGRLFEGGPLTDSVNNAEPYDYPWTNFNSGNSSENQVTGLDTLTLGGSTTVFANMGDGDDAWLASTAPTRISTRLPSTIPNTLVWPQITSLTGAFYGTTGGADPRFREIDRNAADSSARVLVTTDPWNQDVDLITDTDLVDADGDGIGDSRWERAPIPLKDGVEYFMAVRVIDLSSMVNLNTATASTSNGSAYSTNTATQGQGRNPTEIDLFRYAVAHGQADPFTETQDLLELRLNNNGTTYATLPVPAVDRNGYWRAGPIRWENYETAGPTPIKLSTQEELYLRYRNGLVPPKVQTGVGNSGHLQTLMPELMEWTNVGVSDPGTQTNENWSDAGYPDILTYFGDDNTSSWSNMLNNVLNSRLYLTTQSGAAEFLPPVTNTGIPNGGITADFLATRDQMKFPLNDVRFSTTATLTDQRDAVNALSIAIRRVYIENTPTLPAGQTVVNDFADQFAANIQDYRDEDNRVTVIQAALTAPVSYGLEGLPVITEVYAQREYTASSAVDTGGSGTGPYDVTWTNNGDAGYAIELYNPFKSRILLTDVYIQLASTSGTSVLLGGAGTDIASLPGVTAALLSHNNTTYGATPADAYPSGRLASEYLYPDDRLILYINGGGTSGDVGTLITTASDVISVDISAATTTWPDSTDGNTAPETVNIRVLARADNGSIISAPYFVGTSSTMPASFVETGSLTDSSATNLVGLRQRFDLGNAQGLNALTVIPADFQATSEEPRTNSTQNTTTDQLGIQTKVGGAAGLAIPYNSGAAGEPQVYFRDNEFNLLIHPGELAMVLGLSFDQTTTLPEAVQNSGIGPTTFDNLRINLDPLTAGLVDSTVSHLNVPHAVLLMESLSTLSPALDGLDNDGNGAIDSDGADTDSDGVPNSTAEAFVPGKININTAPLAVLANALPFPADYTSPNNFLHVLVDQIRLERETPSRAVSGEQGIASLNELWFRLNSTSLPATPVQLARNTLDTVSLTDSAGNDIPIDVLANTPNPPLPSPRTDGIIDDREEQMLLLNWLQQLTTTRSDVYCAYVLVKGYESGDLSNLVESGRLLVILDRSNVRTPNDAPRILAKFKY